MNLVASTNAAKAFTSNDFTNWQDAGAKSRSFDKHFWSEVHREAPKHFFTIPDACGDISAQLSIMFNEAR